MHSCCTDYARNLDGKRPVRSRNRNCIMYSPTDFTDLHGFYYYTFFYVTQISQIFHPITSLNQMNKKICIIPIDRIGLNLCKSVKSVGHNNRWFKRLDRIGRFPFKFRA